MIIPQSEVQRVIFSSTIEPDAKSLKDPCPVFCPKDNMFHLFCSYGTHKNEIWDCVHFVSDKLVGPYQLVQILKIDLPGGGIAAPGVIWDQDEFHMFVQTEYLNGGGVLGYLSSKDGYDWTTPVIVMKSEPGTDHAGIYDPHPVVIAGVKCLVYSALSDIQTWPEPDIAIAISKDWKGPWDDREVILSHDDVPFHNKKGHEDYEWGLEGGQILQLRTTGDVEFLLTFVSFLETGIRKQERQRLSFAINEGIEKFKPLDLFVEPPLGGENGHGTSLYHDGKLYCMFQQQGNGELWHPALVEIKDEYLNAKMD